MRCQKIALLIFFLLAVSLLASAQVDKDTIQSIASALRANQYEAALHLLDPAVHQFPNDPRLWTMQGVAFSGTQHSSDALAAYRHALKISPDYLPALEGAAQIEYETDGKNAIPLLQHILQLHPDSPTTHAMLGTLAYRQGECSVAVRNFEQSGPALDLQTIALQQYGSCLIKLNLDDQAIAVFQKLVELNPEDSHSRSRLAALQLTAGHPKDAIATLQPLLQGQPDTRVAEIAAGAYESNSDTTQAVSILNHALALDPRNIDLYIDLASLAFDHHSFASGIEVMTAGLRLLPEAAPLYLERGILYVQVADYEKAEADFEKAGQLDPRQSLSEVARGKIAEQNGDFDKALATVRGELAKKPNDAFLLYTQADILVQKGIEPGNQDFRLALESARKAVALQPRLVLARDILSNLYLRAGQFQASIEQSRQTLKYDPKDQSALYHLIMALRKTGSTQELPDLLKRLAELRQESNKEGLSRSLDSQTTEPLQ